MMMMIMMNMRHECL